MKNIFLLLFLLFAILFAACSKRSDSQKTDTSTPAKEIIENNDSSQVQKNKYPGFRLADINNNEVNISIENNNTVFNDVKSPLVLVNFFATWCPPCRGELPYLSRIQKKYSNNLFVVGVLVNDDQNSSQLRDFMELYSANYYISDAGDNTGFAKHVIKTLQLPENFPLPLSVLYSKGKLYRHYEGAMPIEMLESEIKQALKNLQGS